MWKAAGRGGAGRGGTERDRSESFGGRGEDTKPVLRKNDKTQEASRNVEIFGIETPRKWRNRGRRNKSQCTSDSEEEEARASVLSCPLDSLV
ncbi:hypothetical protein E2C01_073912 [Portunus trituberculatus]|uniref:Uncharacterized protein n=1 Tax=Portunus trituberculatus TaxID=210409 RepID=A0A5B7IBU9_PORTR|nr:hypothetical protein [Portunus trituberculatus]